MIQYKILSDDTLEGLNKQINDVAKSGYTLDKFEHSGTANNDWQGIAIMKIEVDSVDEFDIITPIDLDEISSEDNNKYIIRNSDNFPICECYSDVEAKAVCNALNNVSETILNAMKKIL